MLSRFDDYPIHQMPVPVAQTGTADRNHYDRYFFNGYARDGSLYFGVALGLYPNRRVMDAAFAVVRDGVETCVIASRRAPLDPTETIVGPVTVAVEEPLRRLRVTVAANDSGLEANLVFGARTPVVEEPRFALHDGPVPVFDYTRLTQWGVWDGTITAGDDVIRVSAPEIVGCRDRSWGVRPVGPQPPGPPAFGNQFFWLWAPLHFDDVCVHFDVNEHADGRQWHSEGLIVPVLARPSDPVYGPDCAIETMASVSHDVTWEPGTRRSTEATITLTPQSRAPVDVHLEPLCTFFMRGLGYLHPEVGHGHWRGDLAVHAESFDVNAAAPPSEMVDPFHLHVQQVVRATMGEREGIGVFEQLVIGPHEPSGFTDLLDGAR
jgi:hypothetical protein